jgi:two-component system, chemotaxis family, chemotaxis protein CheY
VADDYSHLKILVADDIASARKIIRIFLERLGCTDILEAKDGQEAFEKIKGCQIDVVIADHEMPHLDGYQLLDKIRTNPDTHTLPFVLTTPSATKEDVVIAQEKGVSMFLMKPFGIPALRTMLHMVLKEKEKDPPRE